MCAVLYIKRYHGSICGNAIYVLCGVQWSDAMSFNSRWILVAVCAVVQVDRRLTMTSPSSSSRRLTQGYVLVPLPFWGCVALFLFAASAGLGVPVIGGSVD